MKRISERKIRVQQASSHESLKRQCYQYDEERLFDTATKVVTDTSEEILKQSKVKHDAIEDTNTKPRLGKTNASANTKNAFLKL